MNDFVVFGEKIYPLQDKIVRSKAGKEYKNKHVKITVATDFYSGKQIQHDYTGKTNFEVQDKIDKSKCLDDDQLNLISNDLTLQELIEEYMAQQKVFLCERSYITQLGICENYIYPKLGNIKIKKLKKGDIINLQDSIHKLNCGKSVVLRVAYTIKTAMNYACKKGYISYNPCIGSCIHKYQTPEQTILDQEQIYKLLVHEKDNKYAGLYAVIFFMALRIGEGIGLSWEQINWDKKIVTISQQINANNKLQKSTKNKIDRNLMVPNCVLLYLQRQKNIQNKQKLQNPEWNNPNNFVFTNKNGKPFHRRVVLQDFKRIMQNTSQPSATIHSLRRTLASILAENISIHAVKYYLGHIAQSTSAKYVYPSMKDIEHLSSVMETHFKEVIHDAGIFEFYMDN